MDSNSKTIFIDGVGNIILQKKSIAKYLGIRIKPFEGIFVTVPKRVSYKEAEEFVRSRERWIIKHLPRIQNIENAQEIFDENTRFQTKEHKLVIQKSMIDETIISVNESKIIIEYPWLEDIKSDKIQSKIKDAIILTLRIEAKKHIPRRVEELAYLYGFNYNKVTVKNLKSRWGSCSARNNIIVNSDFRNNGLGNIYLRTNGADNPNNNTPIKITHGPPFIHQIQANQIITRITQI